MSTIIERNKIINRRIFIAGGIKIICFFTLFSRLFYLQILKKDHFLQKAESNRTKTIILLSIRGKIIDRNDIVIADNKIQKRIIFRKNNNKSLDHMAVNRTIKLLNLNPKLKTFFYNKNDAENDDYVFLRYPSQEQIIKTECNLPFFTNLAIDSEYTRVYRHPFAYSHIVGYVAKPTKNDRDAIKNYSYIHPDLKIGKIGLEKRYDPILIGTPGYRAIEINAKNIKIREIFKKLPQTGNALKISIDANLQEFTYDLIKDQVTSVNMIDANTVEILLMVSSSSFNANTFSAHIEDEKW
jgi:penicillin-binding protein 2